jgi:hypothetical protein
MTCAGLGARGANFGFSSSVLEVAAGTVADDIGGFGGRNGAFGLIGRGAATDFGIGAGAAGGAVF